MPTSIIEQMEFGSNLWLYFEHLGNLLPVIIAIAEGNLTRLSALDIEVHIMVPGVADAAVNLHPIESAMLISFPAPGFSQRGSQSHFRLVFHYRPGGVIDYGGGALSSH